MLFLCPKCAKTHLPTSVKSKTFPDMISQIHVKRGWNGDGVREKRRGKGRGGREGKERGGKVFYANGCYQQISSLSDLYVQLD